MQGEPQRRFHDAVLRRKRWAINEMTANSNKRCIKALDTWNTKKPPSHASNNIPNKTINIYASSFSFLGH
jgi:hypothetical protein